MRVFAIAALSVFFFACGGSSEGNSEASGEEVKLKFKEVMAVHDEIMPKMRDIQNSTKALKQFVETGQLAEEEVTRVQSMIDSLEMAETTMMEWMHNFDAERQGGEQASEKITYLEGQRRDMVQIGKRTERALEAAENYLK